MTSPDSKTTVHGVHYFIQDDGGVAFHKPDNTDSRWVCYTKYPILDFIHCLESLMSKSWKTPWDAQEIACRNGLANYSSPVNR